MRIVSLLPSATEIVYALGLGEQLVGRTHACDYPEEVAQVPVVTADRDPDATPDSRRIHDRVAASMHGGSSILRLDRERLAACRPDLVLTQEQCDVCAVSYREVNDAVRAIGGDVTVVSLQPHTIEGILNTITTVGAFAESEDEAVGLVELLRERLLGIEQRVLERRADGVPARRVVVLEWIDPPFAAGHWVPEMVRRAGGWELLGEAGRRSAEVGWDRVRDVEPDVIVLAHCGLDARRAARALAIAPLPAWFDELEAVREGQIYAVDGAGRFSRPGPRIIEGVALLAELFDTEGFADAAPPDAWIPLGPVGIGRRD